MLSKQLGGNYGATYKVLSDNPTPSKIYFGTSNMQFSTSSPNAIPDSAWTNIVAVYDGVDHLLYSNGQNVGTARLPQTLSADNNDLIIGGSENGIDSSVSERWTGQLDEISISNVKRSESWIRNSYLNMDNNGFMAFAGIEFEPSARRPAATPSVSPSPPSTATTAITTAANPIPMSDSSLSPSPLTNSSVILIVVLTVVVCLCTALFFAAILAWLFFKKGKRKQVNEEMMRRTVSTGSSDSNTSSNKRKRSVKKKSSHPTSPRQHDGIYAGFNDIILGGEASVASVPHYDHFVLPSNVSVASEYTTTTNTYDILSGALGSNAHPVTSYGETSLAHKD